MPRAHRCCHQMHRNLCIMLKDGLHYVTLQYLGVVCPCSSCGRENKVRAISLHWVVPGACSHSFAQVGPTASCFLVIILLIFRVWSSFFSVFSHAGLKRYCVPQRQHVCSDALERAAGACTSSTYDVSTSLRRLIPAMSSQEDAHVLQRVHGESEHATRCEPCHEYSCACS